MKKHTQINNKLKLFIFLCLISLVIMSNSIEAFAGVVPVTLPDFDVTMNGVKIDNEYSKYPFIVYKGITYFPMTYVDSRFLGLETRWDNSTGLKIYKTNVSYPYSQYNSNSRNSKSNNASIASFEISVNNKAIKNSNEKYPLLKFRDVTYFPLTWNFIVDEFSWSYSFDNSSGLNIKSQNIVPQELKLTDYISGGDFIIDEENIYYAGNNGAVYKASMNNLGNCKKIYETPLNEIYGPEGSHAYPFFEIKEDKPYFTYHVGGATMGTSFEVEIYDDASVSEPITLPGFAAGGPAKEIINGYAITRYGSEDFEYVTAYEVNSDKYVSHIYKLNRNVNTLSLISNLPVERFKYRDGNIYFISDGRLYSFTVGEDIVKNVNDMTNMNEYLYEVLNGIIYCVNGEDGKIYMSSSQEALNSGEIGSEVLLLEDYVMLKFDSNIPNSYRTIIYDRAGNQVFKSAAHINVLHTYSNTIAYYDDVMDKVFTARLK